MRDNRKPGYWAVLPAAIRYDPDLPPSAKLLYAEISALCDDSGYCFAHNDYFAKNFGVSIKTVQRLIKTLAERGYITVDVNRDPGTNEVLDRKIYAGINPAQNAPPSPQKCGDPSPQKCGDPSPQKCGDPSPQKCGDPSPQKCGVEQDNIYINNTPLPPKGGRGARRRNALRDAPDWMPERFEGFWKFYPKKGRKDKQKAMDAWDKLHPDDALVDTIARSLVKLIATEDWQRGIGIPYVATFLNAGRWRDADELADRGETTGGWADDEEVI